LAPGESQGRLKPNRMEGGGLERREGKTRKRERSGEQRPLTKKGGKTTSDGKGEGQRGEVSSISRPQKENPPERRELKKKRGVFSKSNNTKGNCHADTTLTATEDKAKAGSASQSGSLRNKEANTAIVRTRQGDVLRTITTQRRSAHIHQTTHLKQKRKRPRHFSAMVFDVVERDGSVFG